MQTRAAEMLGVKFPTSPLSRRRDAVLAVRRSKRLTIGRSRSVWTGWADRPLRSSVIGNRHVSVSQDAAQCDSTGGLEIVDSGDLLDGAADK
jgi:hypothetical protein